MAVKPIAAGPGAGTEGLETATRPVWVGPEYGYSLPGQPTSHQERMDALNPHAEPGRAHEEGVKSDGDIEPRRKVILTGLDHILLCLPMVEAQRAVVVAAMKFIADTAALK